ncbi:MAG: hypothetical protein D6705_13965, partial [Deltaproteobacteria bacterium]
MTRALFEGARLVVFAGPGGVGKTTLAAACGVAAARRGMRVLVLTADPARRLAAALGLSSEMADPVPVPLPGAAGALEAAMVVSRHVYDGLLARLLPPDATRALLEKNRMYAAFSRTLARSHAYAAIEHLHRSTEGDRYDLVVLDTPPADATLQLLEAPRRLRAFLNGALLRVFGAGRPAGRRLARYVGDGLLRRWSTRILGASLLAETRAFFDVVGRLRDAFTSRTEKVSRILRDDRTRFVLVTTPGPAALATAADLAANLRHQGLPPDVLLANRAYAVLEPDDPRAIVCDLPPADTSGLPPSLRDVAVAVRTLRRAAAARNAAALERLRSAALHLPAPLEIQLVPRIDDAEHD